MSKVASMRKKIGLSIFPYGITLAMWGSMSLKRAAELFLGGCDSTLTVEELNASNNKFL